MSSAFLTQSIRRPLGAHSAESPDRAQANTPACNLIRESTLQGEKRCRALFGAWLRLPQTVSLRVMEESAQPARTSAGARFLVDFLSDPRRWGVLVAVVLSAGAIWTGLSAVSAQGVSGGATSAPREGFLAPDFRLTLLGGGEVALSELRGQVVIVNLWASWCPPCRAEMPALQEAYEAYRDRGLEILAVNTTYQDSQAAAAGFVQEYGLTFPVPMDQTGEVSRSYLLRALPTSFFIDRDGVIRSVVIGGPMSRTTIQTTVERLLGDE